MNMSSLHSFIIVLFVFHILSFATTTASPSHIFNNGERVNNHNTNSRAMNIPGTLKQTSKCGSIKQLRLALAFDSTFCAYYGSTFGMALNMALGAISDAAAPLLSGACIQLTGSVISGYCDPVSDPYISIRGNPDQILTAFQSAWTVPNGVSADDIHVTYLMTGFDDGSIALGYAYNAAVCSDDAFGWVERANGLSLAHELGHSLSCRHVQSGIMKANLTPDEVYTFSQTSLNSISTYIATAGSCLTEGRGPEAQIIGGSAGKTCLDVRKSSTTYKGGKTSLVIGTAPRSFKIRIKQKASTFKVSFKGVGTKFVALAFKMTTLSTLGQFEVGEWTRWNGGRSAVKFKIPIKNVMVPEGSSTCCGATVYLYLNAIWCEASDLDGKCSRTIGGKKEYVIACKN